MCTKTAKMAVFTEKKEIILTPDTVLPKAIKKLNASKVIYCLVNRVIYSVVFLAGTNNTERPKSQRVGRPSLNNLSHETLSC